MRKSLTGVLVAAAAVGTIALAAPAAQAVISVNSSPNISQQFTPHQNQASAWGDDCYKIDNPSTPFHLTESAAILVIKSATVNDIWYDAAPGWYGAKSGKTISHVIVCPGGEPTT